LEHAVETDMRQCHDPKSRDPKSKFRSSSQSVRRGTIPMTKVAVRTRALTLSLALCLSHLIAANRLWAAPVTSPMGSYGILLNQLSSSNTGNDKTSGLLGVLNFDGAGNVTATYTKVNLDFSVKTGKATGTYSPNPDGSNTVNLTFD